MSEVRILSPRPRFHWLADARRQRATEYWPASQYSFFGSLNLADRAAPRVFLNPSFRCVCKIVGTSDGFGTRIDGPPGQRH